VLTTVKYRFGQNSFLIFDFQTINFRNFAPQKKTGKDYKEKISRRTDSFFQIPYIQDINN